MSNVYAWIDGAVVDIGRYADLWDIECSKDSKAYLYMDVYLVDTNVIHQYPGQRYGMLVDNFEVENGIKWQATKLDKFPNEFKANLLLLGVSL